MGFDYKDDQGRLIASDQYGVLYMVEPKAIGDSTGETHVTPLPVQIGHANGLLWAFNSLYVVVNSRGGINDNNSGLYRVWDSDEDGLLDEAELLKSLDGSGEHGPHAVLLSPDGNSLYVLAGNHTDLPEDYSSIQPDVWDEDQLFPYYVDPRGHANDRKAPGGWVAKVNPEGDEWEIISSGYRNPYDMGFNQDGELLVFDADMEWDMGMPWYRPIRICHATAGSAYGWRTGSGKALVEYPDNLPPVVNIGQGSPTGVIMGKDLSFPTKYQNGLFAFDWSFGTMYYIDTRRNGSSYTGNKEEFVAGVPFPMADGVAGDDGAMYIVAGGRRLTSHLVRISYQGEESTEKPASEGLPAEIQTRRDIEALIPGNSTSAINEAWPHLNSKDRFLQYAARMVIENRPFNNWTDKLFASKDPSTIIQGSIALARTGDDDLKLFTLNALNSIDAKSLSRYEFISLIRAYSLLFIRWGGPDDEMAAKIRGNLTGYFPSGDAATDHILSQLLVYLNDENVVAKAINELGKTESNEDGMYISDEVTGRSEQYGPQIEEMLKNMAPARDISLVMALSNAQSGWTLELRKSYFLWFHDALARTGGMSFKGFMDAMRQRAWANVPEDQKEDLAGVSGYTSTPSSLIENLPQPEGPGKNWLKSEIRNILSNTNHKPDYDNGAKMYQAVLCQACHTMNGAGGNIGPDLSQVGTRFGQWDLLDAIISPSQTVSDQYISKKITLKNGNVYVGRIVREADGIIEINSNPLSPTITQTVSIDDIVSRENSSISPMPPGLMNSLNEDEIVDLISYLKANGDPENEIYQ